MAQIPTGRGSFRRLHPRVDVSNARRLENQGTPSQLTLQEISQLPDSPFNDSSGTPQRYEIPADYDSTILDGPYENRVRLLFRANWQVWNHLRDSSNEMLSMCFIPFGFLEHPNAAEPVNYMYEEAFASRRSGENRYKMFTESLIEEGDALFNSNYHIGLYLVYLDMTKSSERIPVSYKYLTDEQNNPGINIVFSKMHRPSLQATTLRQRKQERTKLINRMLDEIRLEVGGSEGENNTELGYNGNSWIFVNGFVGLHLPSGSCEVEDWPLASMIRKSKCIFSPPPRIKEPHLCFWECVAYAFDRFGSSKRKRGCASYNVKAAKDLRAQICEYSKPISLADVPYIAEALEMSFMVMDIQRTMLLKTDHSLPDHLQIVQSEHHIVLVLQDNHWMYPRSYNGCNFRTTKCNDCKRTFESEQHLQDHRESDECIKCTHCKRLFSSTTLRKQHEKKCVSMPKRQIWMKAPERKKFTEEESDRYFADFESLSLSGKQMVYAGGVVKSNWTEPIMWYGDNVFLEFKRFLDNLYNERYLLVCQRLSVIFDEKIAASIMQKNGFLRRFRRKVRDRIMNNGGVCRHCESIMSNDSEAMQHTSIDVHDTNWSNTCLSKAWVLDNIQAEMRANLLGLNPPISVFAHNGGRYDWKLFMSWLMRFSSREDVDYLIRGGCLLQMKYKSICLKDTVRIGLAGSLDSLAKSYKSPILKGDFPYTFMDAWDKIYGVFSPDEVDRFHFVKEDKEGNMKYKREFSEEEHAQYFIERQDVFNVQEETLKYLCSDILALRNVAETYFEGWQQMSPQLPQFASNYITASQLAFGYFQDCFMPENTMVRLQTKETQALRLGTQGGRVESIRRYLERLWIPPSLEEWENCPYQEDILRIVSYIDIGSRLFQVIVQEQQPFPGWGTDIQPWLSLFDEGYPVYYFDEERSRAPDLYQFLLDQWPLIRYYDVNSEYPFIMEQFLLPVGIPTWTVHQDHALYHQLLNEDKVQEIGRTLISSTYGSLFAKMNGLMENEWHGFACVDITPPQDLHLPVLPERRKMGATYKTMFTLREKIEHVYYSAELMLALEKGYEITRVYWISEFEGGAPFQHFITTMKQEKYNADGTDADGNKIPGMEKNPAKRAVTKLSMNSSFGKTLQKTDGEDHYVTNARDLSELLEMSEEAQITVEPIYSDENGADVLKVSVKYEDAPPPACSNVAIGNAILSLARCWLYRIMDEAMQDNTRDCLAYCDTDSLIYFGRKPRAERLHNVHLGKLAGEFENDVLVKRFVTLSAKVYAFDEEEFINSENVKPFIKAKGINSSHNFAAAQDIAEFMPRYMNMKQDDEIKRIDQLQGEMDFSSQQSNPVGLDIALSEMPQEFTHKGLNFDILFDIVKNGAVTTTMNPQMVSDATKQLTMLVVPRKFRDNYDKRKIRRNDLMFRTEPWTYLDSE